jgi:predicted GH43/DUF377 family glycosyl hydrolase
MRHPRDDHSINTDMEEYKTTPSHFHLILFALLALGCTSARHSSVVSDQDMQHVYMKVRTPYKYGVVMNQPDSSRLLDSPSIFRWRGTWYMSYIVFDGKGYETWLSRSDDLLHWATLGRILSFTDTGWDASQKAGYISLLDTRWGGGNGPRPFKGRYWLSYLGGSVAGYEAGRLGVGMASIEDPSKAQEWTRLSRPVLSANDADARWFEKNTIYKSTVIEDEGRLTGKPFVMFYNAKGDTASYESIGMAVSDDMEHWQRLGTDPVISRHGKGTICGDAQVVKMGKLYVMFFFGAFWNGSGQAFDRFACSYDLVHWTEWKGEDLVKPSESYDRTYAHKPCLVEWKGIVYHFYTAVGDQGRVIALATSKRVQTR